MCSKQAIESICAHVCVCVICIFVQFMFLPNFKSSNSFPGLFSIPFTFHKTLNPFYISF